MLEKVDIQALPTGALAVFAASTFVAGHKKRPRMSRVQRCILEAQDEHFERVRERDAGAFAALDGRSERLHVARCASHVGVVVRARDLWEAHEMPQGVHAATVLVFEQTSSSEFNDGVADVWGERHLACAQLRHLSDVAAAAVARGGSVYALVPERACGNADLFREAYAGVAWREALRAWVFGRKGQPYESPAMLLGMKFGLGRVLRRWVPAPVRESVERWGATCSEMAWEFGRSGLLALTAAEMEALNAADGQDVWPLDLVLREASPWARAQLVLVASGRWRGSDDVAVGRAGSDDGRRDSATSDAISVAADAVSPGAASRAGLLPPPVEGMAAWRIDAASVGGASARTAVYISGAGSRVPAVPRRDDVPNESLPAAPAESDTTVLATPPGSDGEDTHLTSTTYVGLPAAERAAVPPVVVPATDSGAGEAARAIAETELLLARTPRGGVDRSSALAILAQTTGAEQ